MQAPEVLGGRYELRGVLGRGGMAEVRDGWDIRLDRPVAVKLLYPIFTTQHAISGWRFGSANEVRAALAGRIGAPVRPATRVLAAPLPDPTTMVVAPPVRRNRSRLLLLTAVVVAVLVAAVAFIVDSASRPAVPEPASTSTSVTPPPTPITTSLLPTTTPPVPVVEIPPGHRKHGENGNGRKPKGGNDD